MSFTPSAAGKGHQSRVSDHRAYRACPLWRTCGPKARREAEGRMCPDCHGFGRDEEGECETCEGYGEVSDND